MAPSKQTITLNDATSKGKAIGTIGGTVPPLTIDQPHATEDTSFFSPSRSAANVQAPPLQYDEQLLQILTDMKEQMKEQQAQSDRDREQVANDRKNVIRE